MTDPDLLFTAKIRNLTENELVVFWARNKTKCNDILKFGGMLVVC